MSTDDLFLKAFTGTAPSEEKPPGIKPLDHQHRADLFRAGFGYEQLTDPRPHLGQTWKLDAVKAKKAGLGFAELFQLSDLEGTPYDQLPQWAISLGVCIPSKEVADREKKLTQETGLSTVERKQAERNFEVRMEILLDFLNRPGLSNTDIPLKELQSNIERYGEEAVMAGLREMSPEGAELFSMKLRAERAEQAAQKAAQLAEKSELTEEERTREEIKEAQRQIAAMNADKGGLATMSTDEIQAELTRRLNTQTRQSIEEMEG